ncbi:MAG: sigma-70 family RNA polymerase sigma factor [Ruminococcus sp.]|nr:sigma-70 family RNA polymerase sigma factor [Ruminococcus sp.]
MNIFILKDKNNTSAGYIQITEEELQAYKKNSEGKVYLINLGHSIMETDEASFRAFYKERRREKYLREEAQLAGGVLSLNAIDSDELDGVGVVLDTSEPLDEKIMRKMMIEKLPEAISILNDEEKTLIYQLYFENMSERQISSLTAVPQKTINNRRKRILKKLFDFFQK